MNFDWRTDEEQTQFEGAEQAQQPRIQQRRWLWLALVALLALVAGFFLWREAQQRMAIAQDEVRTEVRAAHRLAQRAAAEGDKELFISLLSGRDDEWLQAQLQGLEEERLFAKSARPLGLQPAGEAQVQEIALDAELREAVVLSRQAYVLTGTASITETVSLQHTYVYRSGSRGWLLSPPLDDFWGREWRYEGEWLSLSYPERDETIALRLGRDLDQAVTDFCALPGAHCPQGLQLSAELSTDPGRVTTLTDLREALSANSTVLLPAPTLAGLPLDEAGYEALLQSYARPVLANALAQAIDYDCCRGLPFFSALLHKQLSRLALAPWPLGPEQYERLLEVGVDRLAANQLLTFPRAVDRQEARWQEALSLVDYLEAELGQERLLAEGSGSYGLALQQFDDDPDRFTAGWLDFIHAQSRSGQRALAGTPAPPAPAGVLQFSCSTERTETWLLAYDFDAGEWSELSRFRQQPPDSMRNTSQPTITALEDGYGYVIRETTYAPDLAGVGRFIWRPDARQQGSIDHEDEEVVIHEWRQESEGETRSWVLRTTPTGRFVVLAEYVFRDGFVQAELRTTWLVDVGSCSANGCARQALVGMPVWSPSGQQTLLQGMTVAVDEPSPGNWQAHYALYRGNELAQDTEQVGRGFSPFWLDEKRYGYLRQANDGASYELVIATVADDQLQAFPTAGSDQPQVVARTADFWRALPGEERPETLTLIDVQPLAGEPTRLLVHAIGAGEERELFYSFLLELGDTELIAGPELLSASDSFALAIPSPAGRWLYTAEY
ncbi:MAG: hypothetical protein ACOCXI_17385, partial [Chloroflexota bacterium]